MGAWEVGRGVFTMVAAATLRLFEVSAHLDASLSFLARRKRRGGGGGGSEVQPDMNAASLGQVWGGMLLQYGMRLCSLCYELAAYFLFETGLFMVHLQWSQ